MRALLAIFLLATAAAFTGSPVCGAGYCPTYTCYAPCGGNCVCMVPPGPPRGGRCFGQWAVPALAEAGWLPLHH